MNKTSLLLISSAAALIAVSCDEKISSDNIVSGNQITVKLEVATKAGYEGTVTLPSEFIMDINQGEESNYNYSLVKMTKESDSNIYKAPEGFALTWAGSDHSKVAIKAITMPYGVTSIDTVNPMQIGVNLDQTTEENVKESDLLGASSNNGISINGDDINILFNHLLSKLYVTYSFKSDLNDKNVKVTSLTLKNTCVSGGYSYASMDYDNSVTPKYGDIAMYHDTAAATAECLFCPYVPTENPILSINLTIDGKDVKFNIPVALKSNNGFVGDKRYKMNIKISGTGVEETGVTMVNDWTVNKNDDTIEEERILWIGTSIPAGSGDNNYPKMISDKTGLYIRNNSIGGSFLAYHTYDPETSWADKSIEEIEQQIAHGFCLSATYEEIEAKYLPYLQANNNLSANKINEWINTFKSCSYQSIILPYINGQLDNCTVIVLDHGFNDFNNILHECLLNNDFDGNFENFHKIVAESTSAGYNWIKSLAEDKNPVYKDHEGMYEMGKRSYFQAMEFVINECRKVNPDIKFIIGNYFARKTPHLINNYGPIYGSLCTDLLLYANEAIANIHNFNIVNVYEYTGLDNYDEYNFTLFANDYVHPSANGNTMSNKIIANAYAEELGRILSK